MVLGFVARTATGEMAVLETGRDAAKGSGLVPDSGSVVVDEASWGAAGGDVAGLGQAWGAVDGEGGGLVAVGPGRGGGDAVRRMQSAIVLGANKM